MVNGSNREYLYLNGQRIARREASGSVYYYFSDHLGSTRTITDSSGVACYDVDYYPFGGERLYTNTCGQNYKFTGQERDAEINQDHFWFRQYAFGLGRWTTADPLAGTVANPQSLNRYAYVLNSPLNFIDPLGLQEGVSGGLPPGRHPSVGQEWALYCELTYGGACPFPEGFVFMDIPCVTWLLNNVNVIRTCRGGGIQRIGRRAWRVMEDLLDWIAPIEPLPPPPSPPPVPPVSPCIDTNPAHRGTNAMDIVDSPNMDFGDILNSPITGSVTAVKTDGTGPYPPNAPAWAAREANRVQITNSAYSFTLFHVTSPFPVGATVYQGSPVGVTNPTGRLNRAHIHLQTPAGTDPRTVLPNCQPPR